MRVYSSKIIVSLPAKNWAARAWDKAAAISSTDLVFLSIRIMISSNSLLKLFPINRPSLTEVTVSTFSKFQKTENKLGVRWLKKL